MLHVQRTCTTTCLMDFICSISSGFLCPSRLKLQTVPNKEVVGDNTILLKIISSAQRHFQDAKKLNQGRFRTKHRKATRSPYRGSGSGNNSAYMKVQGPPHSTSSISCRGLTPRQAFTEAPLRWQPQTVNNTNEIKTSMKIISWSI